MRVAYSSEASTKMTFVAMIQLSTQICPYFHKPPLKSRPPPTQAQTQTQTPINYWRHATHGPYPCMLLTLPTMSQRVKRQRRHKKKPTFVSQPKICNVQRVVWAMVKWAVRHMRGVAWQIVQYGTIELIQPNQIKAK